MMLSAFPASLAISREAQMPTNVGLYIVIKKTHTKTYTLRHFTSSLLLSVPSNKRSIVGACTLSRMLCVRVCVGICVQLRRHSSQSVWQKKKYKGRRWSSCKQEMSSSRTRYKTTMCVCVRSKGSEIRTPKICPYVHNKTSYKICYVQSWVKTLNADMYVHWYKYRADKLRRHCSIHHLFFVCVCLWVCLLPMYSESNGETKCEKRKHNVMWLNPFNSAL